VWPQERLDSLQTPSTSPEAHRATEALMSDAARSGADQRQRLHQVRAKHELTRRGLDRASSPNEGQCVSLLTGRGRQNALDIGVLFGQGQENHPHIVPFFVWELNANWRKTKHAGRYCQISSDCQRSAQMESAPSARAARTILHISCRAVHTQA
jgi:hypothetical protein